MTRIFLLATLSFILLSSCSSGDSRLSEYSLKDSVLKEYIQIADSANVDTSEISFKVLNAYQNNDTAFLNNLRQKFEHLRRRKVQHSCINQPKLQDLKADEAYRFVYKEALCSYTLNITITKTYDSLAINKIIYQSGWDADTCNVFHESTQRITLKDWGDFTGAMKKARFWELNRYYTTTELDGSSLTVSAYIKQGFSPKDAPKLGYVFRYGYTTLYEPLKILFKLSGIKETCPGNE